MANLMSKRRRRACERAEAAEHKARQRKENCEILRGWLEVSGLWIAAAVGVAAISYGSRDADKIKNSLANQIDEFRATQRAFVTANDVRTEIKKSDDGADIWSVRVFIENSGTTPTKDLEYSKKERIILPASSLLDTSVGLDLDPITDCDLDYYAVKNSNWSFHPSTEHPDWLPPVSRLPRMLLGPHAKFELAKLNISREDWRDISQGKKVGIITSCIKYHDILSVNLDRTSKLCYIVSAEQPLAGESGPYIQPCRYGNCADDECEDDRDARDLEVKQLYLKRGQEVPRNYYQARLYGPGTVDHTPAELERLRAMEKLSRLHPSE